MKVKWRRVLACVVVVAFVIGAYIRLISNVPVVYDDITMHFKYGSIGSEPVNGIPYWIWKVLPIVFRDKLPGDGYASLGLIQEEGQDRLIGFSQRRVLIDRVWLNC